MKLFVVGKNVFVPLTPDYLLCIGETKDVLPLSIAEIQSLVKAVVQLRQEEGDEICNPLSAVTFD